MGLLMTTRNVAMSPIAAKRLLDQNTANRPMSRSQVEKFKALILAGKWQSTHQGVATNCDGTLIDGQHRLQAIWETGKTVKINLTEGLPKEAIFAIDQNMRIRTPGDCVPILGLKIEVTRSKTAIARALMADLSSPKSGTIKPTNEEVVGFVRDHDDAITYSAQAQIGPCANAAVQAVLARAWYTENRNRMFEFCQVLRTGMIVNSQDKAAITFRNWFIGLSGGKGSNAVRRAIYQKAERALRCFLDRVQFGKFTDSEEELFPFRD